MLKGIDISHHQKGLDLSKIEFDFVIIKATAYGFRCYPSVLSADELLANYNIDAQRFA